MCNQNRPNFKRFFTVNRVLWTIYLSLLGVLLPHTAWAFQQFEPKKQDGAISFVAWVAAFAFEAAIAALTHKLAIQIEASAKKRNWWTKFSTSYLNVYSVGLVVALAVSSLANLAHAVEFGLLFGRNLKIFAEWDVPFGLYAFAFGAVLPVTSLIFARVLSNVVEAEAEEDPALLTAKKTIGELRSELRETKAQLEQANAQRLLAEQRFDAIGDVVARLFSQEKRDKIYAARELWPELPNTAIALIAGASPSYVSETLKVIDEP